MDVVHATARFSQISSLYSNVDSLLNKRNELAAVLATHSPSIIALTELLPKNAKNIHVKEYDIDNYDKFINNAPHRGVIIYTHKSLQATEVTFIDNNFQEFVMCEVKTSKSGISLLIVCIYRSPSSGLNNNDNLLRLLRRVDQHPAKLKCTVGDFNMPYIDWDNGEAMTDQLGKSLYECSLELFLKQNVTQPTRNKPGQTSSLLDLIFTNDENLVICVSHVAPLGKSDHDVLLFQMNLHVTKNTPKDTLCYNKGNYDEFRHSISSYNWNILDDMHIEDSWSTIKNIIVDGVKEHVPKCKPRDIGKPIWLNKVAAAAVKSKNKAYKRYLASKTHYNTFKYKMKRNTATNEVRKAKRSFERNIAKESKENPKAFWRYVKRSMVSKVNVGNLKYNGTTAETDTEKAELLNLFFSNVYTDENLANMPDVDTTNNVYSMRTASHTSVHKKLSKLNVNKSAGPDGLHPRILKELALPLSVPVCVLLNKCFELGKMPSEWKNSNVTCIFKKGDKADPGNYRPVSLTCILSKVAESFVKDYVYNYLESIDYLCDVQHGFRTHRSCTTQLLLVSDIISKRIEEGLDTDIIYLDFQKAFDKVPHKRLLLKLEAAGIRGSIYKFIRDFLSDRSCRFNVNGKLSTKSAVKSGIPQGSILGPFLFIIFINDLPSDIKNHCMMFADDTKIFGNPGKALQLYIKRADDRVHTWQINFNVAKCKVLHFGRKDNTYDYYMSNQNHMCKIVSTSHEKDIGVIFDDNLLFDSHIATTVNKCQGILSIIKVECPTVWSTQRQIRPFLHMY